MARASGRRAKRKLRKMNPVYFVFCEGESEREYLNVLKRNYKVAIDIISKVTGTAISQTVVNRLIKSRTPSREDKVFLFYDLDVEYIARKLKSIKGVTLIGSNPCLELRYLLHVQDQRANLSSTICVKKLMSHWANYKKGSLNRKDENCLITRYDEAKARAQHLGIYGSNPSSTVYLLVDEITAHS